MRLDWASCQCEVKSVCLVSNPCTSQILRAIEPPLGKIFLAYFLNIQVGQKPPVAVGFEPMIKVDLLQVRGDEFLAQFMSLGAIGTAPAASQHCD